MAGKGAMRVAKSVSFPFIEAEAGTLGMNGGGVKLVRSGEHEY